ncbi:CgeB family protein [Hydrogenovibrio sp. 3SP14C1]|uniref:CgeB family protein n=1 Tax=Hydrogenovibrio sp. 3SP14C1 TaxID=3038774 RepID=UPI0024160965|nr:glycosyltransferase [Hydrogenovibrio sp. 3SP14C1]
MRILYVDLQYDYGIQSRGLNLIGQDGFKHSFEKLGHEVVGFYYDDLLTDKELLQQKLLDAADQVKPDLIFFCLYQDQFKHETLKSLKEKYITVNWFGDDQWRFDDFTRHYANDFSLCITTDVYSLTKYKAIGQDNVFLSQWAAIDAYEEFEEAKAYKYDVSFVGGYHPYRAWFIKQLAHNGIAVEAFGNGWPNGPLSAEAMTKLFSESKINLNISNSNSYDIRYLFSSLKSMLLMLRSKKSNSQIKARNFEIPFFGGFQLSDYVPALERHFDIGSEIVCYSNVEEAALQIEYYLNNDFEREKIRNQGQKKSRENDSYGNRVYQVLNQIKLSR